MKRGNVIELLQKSGLTGTRLKLGFIILVVLIKQTKTGNNNVDVAGIDLTDKKGLTIKCRKEGQAQALFDLLKKEGFESISMDPNFNETHLKYGKFVGSVNIKEHSEILRFAIELCMCAQTDAKNLYEVSELIEQYPKYAKQYSESVSKSERSVSVKNPQNGSDGFFGSFGFFTTFKNLFSPAPEPKAEEQQINPGDYISQLPKEIILLIWRMLPISDKLSFYEANKKIKNYLNPISEQAFKAKTDYHIYTRIARTLGDALDKRKQNESIDSSLDEQKTINLYYDDNFEKQLILFAYKPASKVPDHEAKSIMLMLRGDLPLTRFLINRIHTFVNQHQLAKACFLTTAFDTRGFLFSFRGGTTNEEVYDFEQGVLLINMAKHLVFLKLAYEIKEEFNALKSKLIESPINIAQEAILKNYQDFKKYFILSVHPTELKNGLTKFKAELTTLKDKPTEFIDACDSGIKKIEALLKEIDQEHQISSSPLLKPSYIIIFLLRAILFKTLPSTNNTAGAPLHPVRRLF